MVCCEYISLAISFGFVMMSPFWFKMQSSGWVLLFLMTFWWIFFGLLSYSCLYFEMAFLMHSLLYLVVIFWASLFAVRTMVAMLVIHWSISVSSLGGWEIDVCRCVIMPFRMGWFLHCVLFFTVHIVLRIRWYMYRCFFHSFASFFGRKPPCFALLVVSSSTCCTCLF